ncbi:MAG: dehydrogenase E1 component subunit alpha/beta [Candidatus Sumerlaeota bacterium]|nr:dehydrogenase E1 component subunit alpha/beta [Candidatus Sumerlaeota bacterium]
MINKIPANKVSSIRASFTKEEALELYRMMHILRCFDDRCLQLKLKDLIMNGFHPYVGEEAVAVGVCSALKPADTVISTHRPQGHSIAKGSTIERVYAEMLGRIGGVSDGLGGPMQWIDKDHNFYCGSIVGSGITIAAGAALASDLRKTGHVTACFFGDGASNTGSFHEGLNLASIWKLPVLYICENNQYGEAMPVDKFVPVFRISKRAESYGLKGVTVNGMNVFEVADAARKAVKKIRAGKGPQFIEAVTYRFRGHYIGDPLNYRTNEEVKAWQEHDPLPQCRRALIDEFGVSENEIVALEEKLTAESDKAREWALEQRKATIAEATSHVIIELPESRPHYFAAPAEESRLITYSEAIREAMEEEMERDPSVILMGEDVGVWGNLFGCSRGLLEKFGARRVFDTPISEAAIAGGAVGAAVSGMRPVIEIMYIDFISIAMDQIVNHAVKYPQMGRGRVKVPMVVRTQGGVGFRNSSQHSQSLENWFVNIPGLIVVMAATPYDVKGLLKAAIRDDNPVIFIEHKAVYRMKQAVPKTDYVLPLGRAAVKRQGRDMSIVANSWMAVHAMTAAEELAKEGVDCEVIDPLTLYPLDTETIFESVRKTGRCVVVNEAPAEGGFASEVSAVVSENCRDALKKPVRRVTGMRTGIPYDKDLERAVVPSPPWIIDAVRSLLK